MADGSSFEIVCVEIGQGDCTLIRCPDGKVVVIDCGRKEKGLGDLYDRFRKPLTASNNEGEFETIGFWDARELLRDPIWCRSRSVHALVLTHPDQDHFNLVVKLLEGADDTGASSSASAPDGSASENKKKRKRRDDSADLRGRAKRMRAAVGPVGVGRVFHSYPDARSTNSLSRYKVNGVGEYLATRARGPEWHETVPTGAAGGARSRGEVIASGKAGRTPWSVEILVSDHSSDATRSAERQRNERSVITLLQIGQRKALFCGDAETTTLDVLLRHYRSRVSGVDLLLCPHHGSDANYLPDFTTTVAAKTVVVSSGFFEHKHRHPRLMPTVSGMVAGAGTGTMHWVDFWVSRSQVEEIRHKSASDPVPGVVESAFTSGPWRPWGRFDDDIWPAGGAGVKVNGNFAYLEEPGPGVIAVKRVSRTRWYLYREETRSRVYSLSDRTLVFRLGADGLSDVRPAT